MGYNDRLTEMERNFKLMHEAVTLLTEESERQRRIIISIGKVILKMNGQKEDK